VGISAVATYAGEIASGNLESFRAGLPSFINFEQVVTAIISSFLLKKYGRKLILQFGTIGAIITNLIIGIGFALSGSSPGLSVGLILFGLFCYMANFGLSLGPIVWMYIPEIVEPSFLPYSTMLNWGGSALSILLFPIIKAKLPGQNPALLFFFFAIWSTMSFFINKKYIIETKGKSQSQIKDEYRSLQQRYCEKWS
jgi:MFS transporter, SP family, arabinose:H+ symporter